MSEWLKEHDWKSCVGATSPWVRIPLSPFFPPVTMQEVQDACKMWNLPMILSLKEAADAALSRVIEMDTRSELAEQARTQRRKYAQETFRESAPGMPRMDAVMYLVGALEKFDGMAMCPRCSSSGARCSS